MRSPRVMARHALLVCLALGAVTGLGMRAGEAHGATASVSGTTLTIDFVATDATAENVTVAMTGSTITLTGNVTGTTSTSAATRIVVTDSGGGTAQQLTFSDGTYALSTGVQVPSTLEAIVMGTGAGSVAITASGATSSDTVQISAAMTLVSNTTIVTGTGDATRRQVRLAAVDGAKALAITCSSLMADGSIGATTRLQSLIVTVPAGAVFSGLGGSVVRTTGALTLPPTTITDDTSTRFSSSTGAVTLGGLRSELGQAATPVTIDTATAGSITGAIGNDPVYFPSGDPLQLVKEGAGALTLDPTSVNLSGSITVSTGTLVAATANALGTTGTGTTVASGATLSLTAATLNAEPLTINGTFIADGSGNQSTTGSIAAGTNATVRVNSTQFTLPTLTGGASAAVWKRGTGSLVLSGDNTSYAGQLSIPAGRLVAESRWSLGTSSTSISDGATLAVTAATLGAPMIYVNGGDLSLEASSTQTLEGTVSFVNDARITVGMSTSTITNLEDASPGLVITKRGLGTLAIAAATAFESSLLINEGLVQPATGSALGSGNVITVASGGCLEAPAGATLTGPTRIEINGTCGGNGALRAGGAASVVAAPLLVAADAQLRAASSRSLTVSGGITGNAATTLTLEGDITLTSGAVSVPAILATGTTTLDGVTVTAASQDHYGTVSVKANSTLSGSDVDLAAITSVTSGTAPVLTLNITSGTDSTVTGTIGGATTTAKNLALTQTGSGTITLSGTNSYTGATTVNGTVRITSAAALGATATGTTLVSGTLDIDGTAGNLTVAEPITGYGTVRSSGGTNTASGAITNDTTGTIALDAAADAGLIVSGGITATGGNRASVRKLGAGIASLTATSDIATMSIEGGILTATVANAFASGYGPTNGANVTVQSGAALCLAAAVKVRQLNIRGSGVLGSGVIYADTTDGTADGPIVLDADATVAARGGSVLTLKGISGAYGLTTTGTATTVLSAATTHSGTTTAISGTLRITHANAVQASSVVVTAATLSLPTGLTLSRTGAQTLTLGNGAGDGASVSSGGAVTIDRPVAIADASSLSAATGTTLTLAGALSGSGALTTSGPGTIRLEAAGTATSTTAVASGTLLVATGGALPTGAANVASGATLTLAGGTLGGTAALTIGDGGGSTTVTVTDDTTISRPVALAGATQLAPSTGKTALVTGAVSGSGTLTLAGAGTTTLAAANTNSGAIALDTGTLRIGHASALGTATVQAANGTTLDIADVSATGTQLITLGTASAGSVTLSASGAAAIARPISFGGATTLAPSAGATLALNGALGGAGNVTHNGAGTTTFGVANTYSGTTTVSAGTLALGNASALGAAATTVANGGTLSIAGVSLGGATAITLGTNGAAGMATVRSTGAAAITRPLVLAGTTSLAPTTGSTLTVGGAISGNGNLTTEGAGTTALTVANSYAGTTTVASGTLRVEHASGLGSAAVGVARNATLTAAGVVLAGANAITLGATGSTGSATLSATGTGEISRPITVTGPGATAPAAGATLTLSGAISGAGALSTGGAGTTALTTANTYAGAATVAAGTLRLGHGSALGTATLTVGNAGTLELAGITVAGTEAITLGTSGAGSATLTTSANAAISRPIVVGGAATVAPGTTNTLTLNGALSGSGALTVAGSTASAMVVLGTASTHSGSVTVATGVLRVAHASALGTSTVTVGNGATLDVANVAVPVATETITLGAPGAGSPATLTASGTSSIARPIVLAGTAAEIAPATSAVLTLTGSVTGATTALTIGGSGSTRLEADVTTASLTTSRPLGVGTTAPALPVIAATGLITLGAQLDVRGEAVLQAGGLAGAGTITSGGASRTVELRITGAASTYTGIVGAAGEPLGLVKSGAGAITLTDTRYTGATQVQAGTLRLAGTAATQPLAVYVNGTAIVDASLPGTDAIVDAGGTLSGAGSLGNVRMDGAFALAAAGALTFSARQVIGLGGTVSAAINGTTAGQHTLLTTGAGTTRLADLQLQVAVGYQPAVGDQITLLDNQGTLIGAFQGLPQDAVVAAGATRWRISYVGGDGNDVTLAFIAPPTMTAMAPTSGPSAGGTALALTGDRFTAGTTVTVGGSPCTSVVVASATSLACVAPAGTAGAADVVVTDEFGVAVTYAAAYTYIAPAASPSAAPSSSSSATVRASNVGTPSAKRRTVSVSIDAATAGTASLRVTGAKSAACATTRRVTKAGTVVLRCTVKGAARSVTAVASFKPTTGSAVTRSVRLRLSA